MHISNKRHLTKKNADRETSVSSLTAKSVGKQFIPVDASFSIELVSMEIFKFSFLIVILVENCK